MDAWTGPGTPALILARASWAELTGLPEEGYIPLLAVWAVFLLVFAVYIWRVPPLLRRSYGRVFLVFAPLLVLAGLLASTLLSVLGVDLEKAVTGLVGGTIIALGWIITYLVTIHREAETRDRNRRDTLVALRSEIFALVDKLDNQAIRQNASDVQDKIAEGDGVDEDGRPREYYPFSTMESAPIVFNAIADSIPALRLEKTVNAVIRFYAEYTDLRQLVEDSRSETARALSRDRRVSLHEQLTKRRTGTLRWGLRALVTINAELGFAKPGALQRSGENPEISP